MDAFEGCEGIAPSGAEFTRGGVVEAGEAFEKSGWHAEAEAEIVERLDGGAGRRSAKALGKGGADGDGGERRLPGIRADAEEAAEPATCREAAVFHEVLGFEMGA